MDKLTICKKKLLFFTLIFKKNKVTTTRKLGLSNFVDITKTRLSQKMVDLKRNIFFQVNYFVFF